MLALVAVVDTDFCSEPGKVAYSFLFIASVFSLFLGTLLEFAETPAILAPCTFSPVYSLVCL